MKGQQLTLDLFERNSPTWNDVHKGKAELVTVYEPCDKCEGLVSRHGVGYWHHGRCWHTEDRYAFPKCQKDGTCKRNYIQWK